MKGGCGPGPQHHKVAINQKSGEKLAWVGAVRFQDRHHGDGSQWTKLEKRETNGENSF